MSECALKIYEYLKKEKRYSFSSDLVIKSLEESAIKELESNGCIIIKMHTIGYVIADTL